MQKTPNPVITRLSFPSAATFFLYVDILCGESCLVHLHQVFLDIVH